MASHRRRFLATLDLCGAVGIGGCRDEASRSDALGTQPTATPTATPPDYATCENARRPVTGDAEYPDPPDEYTEPTVAAYLRRFELAYKRNELRGKFDVEYLNFKSVEVSARPIEAGFAGTVAVDVGYGTRQTEDGERLTLHADRPYVASYVANRNVVWRAEDSEPVDPRQSGVGELVRCRERIRGEPSVRTGEY